MEIIQLVVIAICAAAIALLLKQSKPELALMVSLAGSAVLLATALSWSSGAISALRSLADKYQVNAGYIGAAVKIVGVAYLGEFGAQLCKDAGESALASKVELGGKALILIMTLPIVERVLDAVASFLP